MFAGVYVYKVWREVEKGEREYHGCAVGNKGIRIILPLKLRLLGRIARWEGDGNLGEANQYVERGRGRILSFRELYTPLDIW